MFINLVTYFINNLYIYITYSKVDKILLKQEEKK